MKVIVAGSRGFNSYPVLETYLKNIDINITEIISGNARGADQLGELYATNNNIPVTKFIPKWNLYGKQAGILRNIEMVNYGDVLVAFWDGKSKGTRHIINYAKKKGLKVYVIFYEGM